MKTLSPFCNMSVPIAFDELSTYTAIQAAQWPPIMGMDQGRLLIMLDYLEQISQWLPASELLENQLKQLLSLIAHARKHTPFYKQHLRHVSVVSDAEKLHAMWQQIPVTTQNQLVSQYKDFYSTYSPPAHGPTRIIQQASISCLKNKAVEFWDDLLCVRDYVWKKRVFQLSMVDLICNQAVPESHGTLDHWGNPFNKLVKTGTFTWVTNATSSKQAELLESVPSDYLRCTAESWSTLFDFYDHCRPQSWSIKEIIITDRILPMSLRQLTEKTFNTPISDQYARPECGIIALRCSEYGQLHIQSEHLLVEILNDENEPCPEDVPGYVTISLLHNYSFPLIRYKTDDRAILSQDCPCGRTLPFLIDLTARSI